MEQNEESFTIALREHLDAVKNKDSIALEKTIGPDGSFYFLLDGRPLSITAQEFMDFQNQSFKNDDWNVKFEVLHAKIEENLDIAITECLYTEPNRNGQPYYNKLQVSYVQEKINGRWYVMLDQTTSFETS